MNDTELPHNEMRLELIRRDIDLRLDYPLRDEEWMMLEEDTYIAGILGNGIIHRGVDGECSPAERHNLCILTQRRLPRREPGLLMRWRDQGPIIAPCHVVRYALLCSEGGCLLWKSW